MENDQSKNFAEKIYSNLNSKNKDDIITEIIMNTDLDKRIEISNAYLQKYERDLYKDLKSNLTGPFKELAINLFLPPEEFMSKMLKNALKGFQIDESIIYEIFTICTQEELKKVELAFKIDSGIDLVQEIEKNFPLTIRKNLINLLNMKRNNEGSPNKVQCERWAQNLVDTNENSWVPIFITKTAEELILIGRYYFKKTGESVMNAIEKRLTNKIRNLLREFIFNIIIPEELFADKIYHALRNNNISILNRILVERNQIDMNEIKEVYKTKYRKELKDDIKNKTIGAHQKLCLHLVS